MPITKVTLNVDSCLNDFLVVLEEIEHHLKSLSTEIEKDSANMNFVIEKSKNNLNALSPVDTILLRIEIAGILSSSDCKTHQIKTLINRTLRNLLYILESLHITVSITKEISIESKALKQVQACDNRLRHIDEMKENIYSKIQTCKSLKLV